MGEEDCEELSLELSIGGKYGKAENLREFCGENAKCEENFSGISADPQRRREIQALRRHEARRKRDVKKWRGVNNVEDKMVLEARKFQGRVGDRETREKDYFLEEKSRKNEVAHELGLSLFSENKNGCLYPKVQLVEANAFGLSDSENSNGVKSVEQCSSAVSDYHSISSKKKGGNNSDTGSHSSPLGPRRHHQIHHVHDSSSQAETHQCLAGANTSNPQPTRLRYAEVSNPNISTDGTNVSSTSDALSKDKRDEPPMPSSCTGNAGRLSRMPCVSATGDGPNGRTVTGFLYRYDKTEVSIMCVCHGSSFSPAEFVKHAGGADVSHPLRHITVVPSVLTH